MEKPILFNTEMVQAILDGRKTCTRRVIKQIDNNYTYLGSDKQMQYVSFSRTTTKLPLKIKIPCNIGDIFYCRETQSIQRINDKGNKFVRVHYKADDYSKDFIVSEKEWERLAKYDYTDEQFISPYWTTKETTRIFLKVIDVRVEKLQDITEEQAKAEGCIDFNDKIGDGNFEDVLEFDLTAKDAFSELWNSTVKDIDQYGYGANPWVWVISFERIERGN